MAFAAERVQSSGSLVVRALAGWFLWTVGTRDTIRFGEGTAAFVHWFEAGVDRATTMGAGYEASEVLEALR